jgi:hypothetical protein
MIHCMLGLCADHRFEERRWWKVLGGAALALVLIAWIGLVVLQATECEFYSDDWAIQHYWWTGGYTGAVSTLVDVLGSKPLLALALPAPYAILGTDPVGHHVVAAGLVLLTVALFYATLREFRFHRRDAIPVALLALLFPWASATRLWPSGSINNLAVVLLFSGLLVALRGLRMGGARGLLMHVIASACYAASILTYETATAVAAMLWTAYVWLHDWRPARPRIAMDLLAVGFAALYTAATTVKFTAPPLEQVKQAVRVARDGIRLFAASLFPLNSPHEMSAVFVTAVLAVLAAVVGLTVAKRRRSNGNFEKKLLRRWFGVAAVAVAATALCWAVYVPGVAFTPASPGLESRVNILALYPMVVLVYALMRSAGDLAAPHGHLLALAGCAAILVGYFGQSLAQERDWARSARLQNSVLAAVQLASPPSRSLVLTFDHPAQVARGVPVFDSTYDLFPAVRVRLKDATVDTYPVFTGAELRCTSTALTMTRLVSPLFGKINPGDNGTALTRRYPGVVFVNVLTRRHAVIRTQAECLRAVSAFTPGPWIGRSIAHS